MSNTTSTSCEQQVVYNIHNFGFDVPVMRSIAAKLGLDIDFAWNDPLRCSSFVLGNLNYSNREKFAFSMPEEVRGLQSEDFVPTARLINAQLSRLIETETQLPTRYDSVRDTGTALDRIFCNIPQNICTILKWSERPDLYNSFRLV